MIFIDTNIKLDDDLVYRVEPAGISVDEIKDIYSKFFSLGFKDKIKTKPSKGKDLSYISWASVWSEIKKIDNTAQYNVYPQIIDAAGNTRFWHDDGKTGWVQVGVTIKGIEHIMTLAIMDYKNAAIPAEAITSTDANKSMMRCLVKACAMHGVGIFVYEGEDIPDYQREIDELRNECISLVNKRCKLSEKAKDSVAEICKAAQKEADPAIPDDAITGSLQMITDMEVLKKVKMQLLAVRK